MRRAIMCDPEDSKTDKGHHKDETTHEPMKIFANFHCKLAKGYAILILYSTSITFVPHNAPMLKVPVSAHFIAACTFAS